MEDGTPDRGPELSPEAFRAPGPRADSLAVRLSRDLAEAMDGTLETAAESRGFSVMLTLPGSAPGGSTTSGRNE